ncbi:unnamed protein product [Effrenium voratum]|uniref:RING-type domain-containing protein n=1 Tax=Effrenium voratum TaxID=2562239 RepID=A0AA36HVA8_9DINO|nr:unnamed protein product [Effrenium voratum]
MSFIQQLATQSQATQQAWVQRQAEAFKAKCMEASRSTTETSCAMTVTAKPGKQMANLLQAELKTVGFSSLNVSQSQKWPDQIHIKASWDAVKAAPAPKHHAPAGGVSETCGICQERALLTALAPCGHTMCRGCLKQHGQQVCPFCRQPVQAATNSLFIG